MDKTNDLTGKRFGRLIVIGRGVGVSQKGKYNRTMWECVCDCGKTVIVAGNHLPNGHTTSCGCYNVERIKETQITHGASGERLHQIWVGMIKRTTDIKNKYYSRYGGRGITTCDKWTNYEAFKNDMQESYLLHYKKYGKKNTTIDRKDNNIGYELSNCRWATLVEQNNNKSSNKIFLINGTILTAIEIARKYKITYSAVMHRINRNWSLEDLIMPLGYRRILSGSK